MSDKDISKYQNSHGVFATKVKVQLSSADNNYHLKRTFSQYLMVVFTLKIPRCAPTIRRTLSAVYSTAVAERRKIPSSAALVPLLSHHLFLHPRFFASSPACLRAWRASVAAWSSRMRDTSFCSMFSCLAIWGIDFPVLFKITTVRFLPGTVSFLCVKFCPS
jgi:hypothetical protein